MFQQAFLKTDIPERGQAHSFLKKWGQKLDTGPDAGDTGIPYSVTNHGEKPNLTRIALSDIHAALKEMKYSVTDSAAEPFTQLDGVSKLAVHLRTLRDKGRSGQSEILEGAHRLFCSEASTFQKNSPEWKLLEKAMHQYPGLRRAKLVAIPEIGEAKKFVEKRIAQIQSIDDLDEISASALHTNVATAASGIGLRISHLSLKAQDNGEESMRLEFHPSHLLADNLRIQSQVFLTALTRYTGSQFVNPDLKENQFLDFTLQGNVSDLILANPREVAELAGSLLPKTGLQKLLRSSPELISITESVINRPPQSLATHVVASAFEPFALQVQRVQITSSEADRLSLLIFINAENPNTTSMLSPEQQVEKEQLAVQALSSISGLYIERSGDQVGAIVQLTVHGSEQSLESTSARDVRKAAIQLRNGSKEF